MKEVRSQPLGQYDIDRARELLGPADYDKALSCMDQVIKNITIVIFRVINYIFGDGHWYNNAIAFAIFEHNLQNPVDDKIINNKIDRLFVELQQRSKGKQLYAQGIFDQQAGLLLNTLKSDTIKIINESFFHSSFEFKFISKILKAFAQMNLKSVLELLNDLNLDIIEKLSVYEKLVELDSCVWVEAKAFFDSKYPPSLDQTSNARVLAAFAIVCAKVNVQEALDMLTRNQIEESSKKTYFKSKYKIALDVAKTDPEQAIAIVQDFPDYHVTLIWKFRVMIEVAKSLPSIEKGIILSEAVEILNQLNDSHQESDDGESEDHLFVTIVESYGSDISMDCLNKMKFIHFSEKVRALSQAASLKEKDSMHEDAANFYGCAIEIASQKNNYSFIEIAKYMAINDFNKAFNFLNQMDLSQYNLKRYLDTFLISHLESLTKKGDLQNALEKAKEITSQATKTEAYCRIACAHAFFNCEEALEIMENCPLNEFNLCMAKAYCDIARIELDRNPLHALRLFTMALKRAKKKDKLEIMQIVSECLSAKFRPVAIVV